VEFREAASTRPHCAPGARSLPDSTHPVPVRAPSGGRAERAPCPTRASRVLGFGSSVVNKSVAASTLVCLIAIKTLRGRGTHRNTRELPENNSKSKKKKKEREREGEREREKERECV
jgi:hypothetical protein